MGKFLMIVGVLLIVAGIGGMVYGSISSITGSLQFGSQMRDAVEPDEAELCNPGERLEEETGAEEYRQGVGYGRPVRYTCVDSKGNAREVTGQFVTGMVGDALSSTFGTILPSVGMSVLAGCPLALGIFLLVIGAVLNGRRRASAAVASPYGVPVSAEFMAYTPGQPSGTPPDLANRLRQLDEARRRNLITEDDHQRLRREALDSMR